jgi:hypothetical protein
LDSGMFNVDTVGRNDTLMIYAHTYSLTPHNVHTIPNVIIIIEHTIHPNHPALKPRQPSARLLFPVHTALFCRPAA